MKMKSGFLFGVLAGAIDVVPMLIQNMSLYFILSAFVFWIVAGLAIFNFTGKLKGFLKGMVIAMSLALPIIIIVLQSDKMGALSMVVMSAILGSILGFISDRKGQTAGEVK